MKSRDLIFFKLLLSLIAANGIIDLIQNHIIIDRIALWQAAQYSRAFSKPVGLAISGDSENPQNVMDVNIVAVGGNRVVYGLPIGPDFFNWPDIYSPAVKQWQLPVYITNNK